MEGPRLSISQQIFQATVEYLAQRPYREVAKLLGALDQDVKPCSCLEKVQCESSAKVVDPEGNEVENEEVREVRGS